MLFTYMNMSHLPSMRILLDIKKETRGKERTKGYRKALAMAEITRLLNKWKENKEPRNEKDRVVWLILIL